MTLAQLKYFVSAVKNGSITKAANDLYVSQPAISMAIKELEKEFDTKLFNIIDGKITLTPQGKKFHSLAIRLINSEKNFINEMEVFTRESKSTIKIGIPPMIGSVFIPKLVDYIAKYKEQIKLEIVDIGSNFNEKVLLDGEVDFAIRGYYNTKISNFVNASKIDSSSIYFVTNKENDIKADTISISEASSYPLVLMKDDILLSTLIQSYFENLNKSPNIMLKSNQLKTIENLVVNNNVCAFSFKGIFTRNEKIREIKLKEDITFEFNLIWDKKKTLEEYQQKFIDLVSKIKIFD